MTLLIPGLALFPGAHSLRFLADSFRSAQIGLHSFGSYTSHH